MGICPYCECDESVCDRMGGWPQRSRCWENAWNLRGIDLSATRSKLALSNHELTALRAENARLRSFVDAYDRAEAISDLVYVAELRDARAALDAKEVDGGK